MIKLAEHMPVEQPPFEEKPSVRPAPIGQLLRRAGRLSEHEVARVLEYTRDKRLRFGEAAVRLHLVEPVDVLEALSQQFRYPYANGPSEASGELITALRPFGEDAEAFRGLRSELADALVEQDCRAVAFVSPDIGDGKSYVAANLAVSFSQLGARTLLIDADLRRPRLHRIFGIDSGDGLSNALAGRSEGYVARPLTQLPFLYVLPAGPVPPNPLELLQHAVFRSLVSDMLDRFDHVLVDTPAAARGADARFVAAACGAALVIGRKDHSRIDALQALLDSLQRRAVKVAGVMINEH